MCGHQKARTCVYTWVCVYVCGECICTMFVQYPQRSEGCWIPRNWHYRRLWAATWVLGTKPESSVRPVGAPNHWTISSTLRMRFIKRWPSSSSSPVSSSRSQDLHPIPLSVPHLDASKNPSFGRSWGLQIPQLVPVSMSSGKARTFGSNKFTVYNCLVMSNVLTVFLLRVQHHPTLHYSIFALRRALPSTVRKKGGGA